MGARPKPFEWSAGPFLAMRFNQGVQKPEPGDVYYTKGILPHRGRLDRQCAAQAEPTGAASSANPQGLEVFRTGSAPRQVAVISGEIYLLDTTATVWTKMVTTANLTTASITLATSGHVYITQFGATLIFNDGTNQPFQWDGTSGAGGLTLLSNAPSKCYGKPAVFYAKVFFIKDVASAGADRDTIVWSEENDATTGYEAGGFNNAWTLTQTRQGPLVALLGTNGGLYYFRGTSIGVIRGAVTSDFTAAGVHDDISQVYGTHSPHGPILNEGYIWFVNQAGKPCRFAVGGTQVQELWWDILDAYDPDIQSVNSQYAQIAAFPFYNAVAFALITAAVSTPGRIFLFHAHTGRAICEWDPLLSDMDTVYYMAPAAWTSSNAVSAGIATLSKWTAESEVASVMWPPATNVQTYVDQPTSGAGGATIFTPTHTGVVWFWPVQGTPGSRVHIMEAALEVVADTDQPVQDPAAWKLTSIRDGAFYPGGTEVDHTIKELENTHTPTIRGRLVWGLNLEGKFVQLGATITTFVTDMMAIERIEVRGATLRASPLNVT